MMIKTIIIIIVIAIVLLSIAYLSYAIGYNARKNEEKER